MDDRYIPVMPRPTERALRPTSASAKLQSHPSFYAPIVGSSKKRAPSAYPSLSRRSRRALLGIDAKVEEEEDYKTEGQLRRSTVTGAEQLEGRESKAAQAADQHSGDDSFKTKVEEFVTISILRKLLMAFIKNRQSRFEEGRLSKEEFTDILQDHLSTAGIKAQQTVAFFEKIDWPNNGYIGWSDFCTYMQLQYSQREDLYVKDKAVHLVLPAKSRIAPHRDDVIKIIDIGDNMLLSCGKDGYVCFWTAATLELRRHKDLIASASSMASKKGRSRAKWSTDACVMFEFNKICIATGDREFLFYELSSLASYCQVAKLPGIPISLCYSSRMETGTAGGRKGHFRGNEEGIFVFGDTNGQVHIISLKNPGEFLRTWKKAKPVEAGGMPTTPFDEVFNSPNCRYVCWQVHNDWAHSVFHWKEIDQIVSGSNDSNASFVVGCVFPLTNVNQMRDVSTKKSGSQSWLQPIQRPSDEQIVFKVHKGVKALTASRRFNLLITGGMDRCLRIWNPFAPNMATGLLRGHAAPIISISVDDNDARIFSFSQDKSLRVWSLLDHNCLLSVKTKSHKIVGDLQVAAYSPSSKVVAMATDRMSVMPVFTRTAVHMEVASTHREPVTCCLYNPVFNHVVTCSEGSVICVWDLDTGGLVFEFGEAHGEQGITSASFDVTWRRLVTGGRDGVAHLWNYNNGHRLKTLMPSKAVRTKRQTVHKSSVSLSSTPAVTKRSATSKLATEICAVSYVELNKNRMVITTGWDRRVNVFLDNLGVDQAEIQAPSFRWDDDIDRGHRDDILAAAQCAPNWLATGGFDGQLIIWNMVSGHQLANLDPPDSSMTKSANPATVSGSQDSLTLTDDFIGSSRASSPKNSPGTNNSRNSSRTSSPKNVRPQSGCLSNAASRPPSSRISSARSAGRPASATETVRSEFRSASRNMERSPERTPTIQERVQMDSAVRKLIFLAKRVSSRSGGGAHLVAAGPHGCLHFWNTHHGGKLLARVAGSALNEGVATAVALDDSEEFLFTGDSFGFVYKWNIENYALTNNFEDDPPELRCFFRCHVETVSSITYIAKHLMILTSSSDCTVRMWDLMGGFIGTFGQPDLWDIRNPSTFRRPHVPYDVLIDPLSVPGPSGTFEEAPPDPKSHVTLVEVLAEMKQEQKQMEADRADVWSSRVTPKFSSDEQIEEDIQLRCYSAGMGKRLRHERQKTVSKLWLGPSHYQSLKCHDLDEGPAKAAQKAEATKNEIRRQVPRTSIDELLT